MAGALTTRLGVLACRRGAIDESDFDSPRSDQTQPSHRSIRRRGLRTRANQKRVWAQPKPNPFAGRARPCPLPLMAT
jgi:hypothetical protein